MVSDARVVRTREALHDAMMSLAEESPLDAITVRAIAARAGVGYATFFRHYPDKDALLADVADRLIREFLQRVAPLLQVHGWMSGPLAHHTEPTIARRHDAPSVTRSRRDAPATSSTAASKAARLRCDGTR